MSKRTFMTNITPLPRNISRDAAIAMLHDHHAMIELNPLVLRHVDTHPPPNASSDEIERAVWYEITDRINYLPGGAAKGEVSYKACFYNLPSGLQTHVFAPAGVDIRSKWSVGGSLPGEQRPPAELGLNVPADVLYIKEDVDLRCNVFMSSFVRRNLKKSHLVVADKIVKRAEEMGLLVVHPIASLSERRHAHSTPIEAVFTRETSITMQLSPHTSNVTSSSEEGPIHYSYPRHCACEGSVHKRSCTFHGSNDVYEAIQHHNQKPFYTISLPSDASLPTSPWAALPQSEAPYPELYGSPTEDGCLCTGALHGLGCPKYPGLRLAPTKTSSFPSSYECPAEQDTPSTSTAHHRQYADRSSQQLSMAQAFDETVALYAPQPGWPADWSDRDLVPSPLQTRRTD